MAGYGKKTDQGIKKMLFIPYRELDYLITTLRLYDKELKLNSLSFFIAIGGNVKIIVFSINWIQYKIYTR